MTLVVVPWLSKGDDVKYQLNKRITEKKLEMGLELNATSNIFLGPPEMKIDWQKETKSLKLEAGLLKRCMFCHDFKSQQTDDLKQICDEKRDQNEGASRSAQTKAGDLKMQMNAERWSAFKTQTIKWRGGGGAKENRQLTWKGMTQTSKHQR
jgi:hypothetical protein